MHRYNFHREAEKERVIVMKVYRKLVQKVKTSSTVNGKKVFVRAGKF